MRLRTATALSLAGIMLIGTGCSVDYDAEPLSPHTPDSVPECFSITRDDDGVKDGIGTGIIGVYCREEADVGLNERLGYGEDDSTRTTEDLGYP